MRFDSASFAGRANVANDRVARLLARRSVLILHGLLVFWKFPQPSQASTNESEMPPLLTAESIADPAISVEAAVSAATVGIAGDTPAATGSLLRGLRPGA